MKHELGEWSQDGAEDMKPSITVDIASLTLKQFTQISVLDLSLAQSSFVFTVLIGMFSDVYFIIIDLHY